MTGLRIAIMVLLTQLVSGCVGVWWTESASVHYSKPYFAISRYSVGSVMRYSDTSLPWSCTKSKVLTFWGEPSKKEVVGNNSERWFYYQPNRKYYAALTFEADELAYADTLEGKPGFCGYMISDEKAGFSCD